ncbi:hypothetical protein THIOSC15_3620023 [uncultured Thiomicrorhabdus sp.]
MENFWTQNFNKIKTLMSQPVILDGRNLYDKNFLKEQGFTYFGVGR